MMRTVGICLFVVVLVLVVFALLSRYSWNPLDRLANPPATATAPATPPAQ